MEDFTQIGMALAHGANLRDRDADVRRANDSIHEANAIIAKKNDIILRQERDFEALAALAKEGEARVEELSSSLNVAYAQLVGYQASIEAFKKQHPDSPMLAKVGEFEDGFPLSKHIATYIEAFDAEAKLRGIKDHERRRFD